jgi:hypothetical protein
MDLDFRDNGVRGKSLRHFSELFRPGPEFHLRPLSTLRQHRIVFVSEIGERISEGNNSLRLLTERPRRRN